MEFPHAGNDEGETGMSAHEDLAELLIGNNDSPDGMWRQGVVTAVAGSLLTVRIGNATTPVPGLRYFYTGGASGYVPAVNDVVHLLPYGKSFIVMGKLA
jgi:hypothetical protein